MGTKLNTRPDLVPTPLVNVKQTAGQTFTGKLVNVRSVEMGFGDKNVYEFEIIDTDMPLLIKVKDEYTETEVKENALVSIFAPSRLDYALKQASEGQVIKITYLGLGKRPKRGGNAPHEYEVEIL